MFCCCSISATRISESSRQVFLQRDGVEVLCAVLKRWPLSRIPHYLVIEVAQALNHLCVQERGSSLISYCSCSWLGPLHDTHTHTHTHTHTTDVALLVRCGIMHILVSLASRNDRFCSEITVPVGQLLDRMSLGYGQAGEAD